MGKFCLCCGVSFCPYPGRPHQEFCSKAGCQRERRRRWHREKMANDEVYRKGQSDCQQNWLERHPDYWREYRASHPAYCERNRQQQGERNRRRRAPPDEVIAKMDEVTSCNDVESCCSDVESGKYILVPFRSGMIAKMDEVIVQLAVITAKKSMSETRGP